MAEAKKKQKTLFHVVKPLIRVFNLIHGFNFGNRKPPGCVQRLYRKLLRGIVWLFFLFSFGSYVNDRKRYDKSVYHLRLTNVLTVFSGAFYLMAFKETEMERLLRRLKRYEMGNISERVTSKMMKLFLLTLGLMALPIAKIVSLLLEDLIACLTSGGNSSDFNLISLQERISVFFSSFFLYFGIGLLFFFQINVMIFPVFNAFLCCVLVSYCPSRLDDHVEDIRRAHSPLRRGKLLSKVCYEYYQLQPLASMTNRSMATTMSLMKIVTMLSWVMTCNILEETSFLLIFFLPILQYSIPLLMYLLVAPSANDMRFKVFTAATEVLMVDDQWRVNDPISRELLMKMRLTLLKHLVHMEIDHGLFTLLGDSVDPETLFTIFIEANDLRTTLLK